MVLRSLHSLDESTVASGSRGHKLSLDRGVIFGVGTEYESVMRCIVDPDNFLKLPRFQLLGNAVKDKVRKLKGCLWLHEFAPSEPICQKDEAGNTAFFLLDHVDLSILAEAETIGLEPPSIPGLTAAKDAEEQLAKTAKAEEDRARKEKKPTKDVLSSFLQYLTAHPNEKRAFADGLAGDSELAGWLRQSADAGEANSLATIEGMNPPPQMFARELIGEMALLNRQPRRATVVAERRCFAVELLDNVFQELFKDEVFQAEVNSRYLRRLREFQLRDMALLNCLDPQQFDKFFPVEQSTSPGEGFRIERKLRPSATTTVEICKQGAEANEIYLIRQGWVRVKVKTDDQERTIAYRGPGEFLGELALFGNDRETFAARIGKLKRGELGKMFEPGKRTATCEVVGHPNSKMGWVELVVIPYLKFWELVKESAKLREALVKEAEARVAQMERPPGELIAPKGVSVFLDPEHHPLGLYRGTQLMLIDLDRCTRCDECVRGCVHSHGGQRSRLYLEGPRTTIAQKDYLVPRTCRSCDDPVCMAGCPTRAIQRGNRGQIVIRDNMCIGCSSCANNCPFGSIQMHGIGLLPDPDDGWHFLPESRLAEAERRVWFCTPTRQERWLPARTPFTFTRDDRDRLALGGPVPGGEVAVLFWREVDRPESKDDSVEVKLEVKAAAGDLQVWLDGEELPASPEPAKGGKKGADHSEIPTRSWTVKMGARTEAKPTVLLALRFTAKPRPGEVWLEEVRLDQAVIEREEWDILYRYDSAKKPGWMKPQLAVVCDLCEDQPHGPACVRSCPHDATRRFDARAGMPTRW